MPLCTVGRNEVGLASDTGELNNSSLETHYLRNKHRLYSIYYSLINVPWDIFGTITWKDGIKRQGTWDSESLRREDFRKLIKLTCIKLKMRAKDIGYYHAMERGAAGECHFHFLIIYKYNNKISPVILADTLQNVWTSEICPVSEYIPGMGTAKIEPFDIARKYRGVSYCCKKEYDYWGYERFERERFDYPSPNLMRMLIKNANPTPNPSNN